MKITPQDAYNNVSRQRPFLPEAIGTRSKFNQPEGDEQEQECQLHPQVDSFEWLTPHKSCHRSEGKQGKLRLRDLAPVGPRSNRDITESPRTLAIPSYVVHVRSMKIVQNRIYWSLLMFYS
jgi:hypothetical protein